MNMPLRSADVLAGATRPLSIVHIVRQYYPNRGGLEDVVANLSREQLRAGWDVRVITLDRLFRNLGQTLPARETIDGVSVIRIPFRGSIRYPLAPSVLRHLAGADVVHVHAVDFFFDALALSKPFHRLPIVATTHGGFFHTGAFSSLKTLWFNGPTRATANLYDGIVACSPSDARAFERIVSGVRLIENGADLEKFAGSSSPVPVKRIVTLGRFSANKHPERVVAAMKALVAQDPDWRLDMVGAPSDWTLEALDAEIAKAGLQDRATAHVGLDNREVANVMRGASVFVSASAYEGFGVALVEAMSAGLKPVVHPNDAFMGLAARHGSIGLVDFADPAAAAGAIRQAHAQLLEQGPAALPTAEELRPYAWPEVAARYAEAYRAAIARRHPRAADISPRLARTGTGDAS
ncbi:glycosyltransferase family 4 protein [Methylopila sp. M107]|uniref:glycosyltransferase family 4 protein n=1 Tax=Methylopila sp. M107 TaxID=1101190 RepID=UPI00036AE24A|nr:glycosyltransferase family 4 protein [Methylopila sp. M107]